MRVEYHHPDDGDDPQPDPFRAADEALAREMGRWLATNYPRQYQLFHATVDHAKGFATLRMPMLMGGTNVYILHIPVLQEGPVSFAQEMKEAAGQLLERYRLARGRSFDQDDALQKIKETPRIGLENRAVPE